MTHKEAKEKFNVIDTPLTDMEVYDLAKKTEDNFITVHVDLDFGEIAELGEHSDFNDPILDRCFESGMAQDISYNIVGIIENDNGNRAIISVTCDVTDVVNEMDEED